MDTNDTTSMHTEGSGLPPLENSGQNTLPAHTDRKHIPISTRLSRSSAGHPAWEPGQEILDGYRVHSILGKGGMGIVYLVEMPLSRQTLRYAVKTLCATSEQHELTRRLFLRELRTWIELPVHPHIVRCHFFRTVEDKLAIFSEFIDGGSLHARIRRDPVLTLPEILDLAIQSAMGLLIAHRHGVIHQDVKPANILITQDGIAKITDFGLARAFVPQPSDIQTSPSTSDPASAQSSSHGMTPLYCSHEQAAGQKVDYRTDIWSWGLTVLELLCRGTFWRLGSMAPMILDTFIAGNAPGHPRPDLHPPLIDVLRTCFQEKKSLRWQSFEAIIQRLIEIYRDLTGSEYRRESIDTRALTGTTHYEGSTPGPITKNWIDPVVWVERLGDLTGNNASGVEFPTSERPSSIRAAALADLECYEAIQISLEKTLSASAPQHMRFFSEFLFERARIHRILADYYGARKFFDGAMASCGIHDSSNPPIGIVEFAAEVMSSIFQNHKDLNEYDAAISTIDALIDRLAPRILDSPAIPGFLGRAYRGKASLASRRSVSVEVERIFDQGQSILEDLVFTQSRSMHATELARLYATRATFLSSTGRVKESIELFDRAAAIWEPMMGEASPETVVDLINVYRNKAIALRFDKDFDAANPLFHRVSSMFEELVYHRGRLDMLSELAISYMNEANGLSDIKSFDAAVLLFDRAIEITERMFFEEGRTELVYHLALEYNNKGVLINTAGRPTEAIPLYERALELYENLVFENGLLEHRMNLAWTHENLATSFARIDRWEEFERHFDRYEWIVQTVIESSNRCELYVNLIVSLCDKLAEYLNHGFHAKALGLKTRIRGLLREKVPEAVRNRLDSLHPEVRTMLGGVTTPVISDTDAC